MDIARRIQDLRKRLQRYNYEYYVLNASTISDAEFDELMRELIALETDHPEFVDPLSPSQRVGGQVVDAFKKVSHERMMLSLANAYSLDDVQKFDERVKSLLNLPREHVVEYVCELKIDGLAIALHYDDGHLTMALTRGDGSIGEDVTHNVKTIRSIPLHVSNKASFEVRGEVFMARSVFTRLNKERREQGEDEFANPRNAASGSIRQLDSSIAAQRQLDAFLYTLLPAQVLGSQTHDHALQWLDHHGFKTNQERKRVQGIDDVWAFIQSIQLRRDNLAYDIDGIVIKVNDLRLHDRLGYTSKTPRWAIAYKFPPDLVSTTLERVFFTVGRTGKVTPNAALKPIHVAGSMIARATLHNEDFLRLKDLHEGDTVFIRKAGDVIPEVVKVDVSLRHPHAKPIEMITHCPMCHTLLVKVDAMHYCLNAQCGGRQQEGLVHYVSKDAMDIDGLGEKIIQDFVAQGWLSDVSDFYSLHEHRDALLELEGYSDKSVNQLLDAIEASKSQSLERLLFGLGIHDVGEKTAKQLAKHFETMEALMLADEEYLVSLPDIGPKTATSFVRYCQNPRTIGLITRLKNHGVSMRYLGKKTPYTSTFWMNKTVVITGSFTTFGRSQLAQLLEERGAKIVGSVSSKTNLVLVGDDAGSKLSKAKELGIETMDEASLLTLLNEEKV